MPHKIQMYTMETLLLLSDSDSSPPAIVVFIIINAIFTQNVSPNHKEYTVLRSEIKFGKFTYGLFYFFTDNNYLSPRRIHTSSTNTLLSQNKNSHTKNKHFTVQVTTTKINPFIKNTNTRFPFSKQITTINHANNVRLILRFTLTLAINN